MPKREVEPHLMKATFKKNERLCKLSDFKKLFTQGKAILLFPLKVHYIFIESATPITKVAFSVSSKKIKKATERNYLKRIMREAYRKNKHILLQHQQQGTIFITFVYLTGEKFTYSEMEKVLCLTLHEIKDKYIRFHLPI